MNKGKIKDKLKIFYEKASLLRKKTKRSEAMEMTLADSKNRLLNLITDIDLKEKSIADIGGADGSFIFQLCDIGLIDNTNIILIDISDEYIKRAKIKYKKEYKNKFLFSTICSDVDNLKIKNKFDVVFFREILEHLYFPDDSLKNVSDSIKKNGFLVISTPNRNRLSEIVKHLLPKSTSARLKSKFGTDVEGIACLEKELGVKEHIHEYNSSEIKKLLKRHGFEIIYLRTTNIPFIAQSLCDKYKILFFIQKSAIEFLQLIGMRRFFGFEYLVLARKIR